MLTRTTLFWLVFLPISSFAQGILLFNGKIYTGDSTMSVCSAIAIERGLVIDRGTLDDLQKKYPKSALFDLKGVTVVPGFHDAHCHWLGYALGKAEADLKGTSSMAEVVSRLKNLKKKYPEKIWLTGRGWDQNDWKIKEYPDRQQLDSAFPDQPVFISRVDGHAALVNSKALKLAGITEPKEVKGGEIEWKNGRLTGILVDNAVDLVKDRIPMPDRNTKIKLLKDAEQDLLEVGLTSITDAGLDLSDLLLLDSLYRKQFFKIRLNAMASATEENLQYFKKQGKVKYERFKIDSYKLYADGALGSRGACLMHPYTDKPQTMGFLLSAPAKLNHIAEQVFRQGFQLNTHCIGDSANRIMLNIYSSFLKKGDNRRWRIEHAQIVHPIDRVLFSNHDVIPSVQPTHCTSDMYWAASRLGPDRISYAYTYKTLYKVAGILACGSDFPVESIRPLLGFYAAVSRQDADQYPSEGFQSDEALTRNEALRCMTQYAAYAAFTESFTGVLAVGYAADLVLLDQDIMQCHLPEILQTGIISTMIQGQWVYVRHTD